jgi:IS30 family transposase
VKKAQKLNKSERLEIQILHDKQYSVRSIAKTLGRSPSTVSRELQRNRVSGEYTGLKASQKSYHRRKYSRFQWKKINHNLELRNYVINGLKQGFNPDEIAGRMKLEKQSFSISKNSIYRWLYSTQGSIHCKYLATRRYVRRRRTSKTRRVMILDRIGIEERSDSINSRLEYGHLEVDTIVSGKGGSGALLVSIDRKSRYVTIRKLAGLRPAETALALKVLTKKQTVKTMTFDNGIENRCHQEVGIPTYFCDPYSSWQKGSVENVNKMIRHYVPKGTSIATVPVAYLDYVQNRINKKPRRILGYKSALEVMCENQLLCSESVAIEGGM